MSLKNEIKIFYMNMASQFAALSKDPKVKVGGVIVTVDGILYPGYNGTERGGPNERDSLDVGQSGYIHCEQNCLIKYNPSLHQDSLMFLTHSPCRTCARMIVNARTIKEVYYNKEYMESDGLSILKQRGIYCEKVSI